MSSTADSSNLILDAWPVLEWVKGRGPARAAFHSIVEEAFAGRVVLSMSRINHGEVIYSIRKHFPPSRAASALTALAEIPIRLRSVDDALFDEAVNLKALYPISCADAFAVALAVRENAPLVTGDPELCGISLYSFYLHWVGR